MGTCNFKAAAEVEARRATEVAEARREAAAQAAAAAAQAAAQAEAVAQAAAVDPVPTNSALRIEYILNEESPQTPPPQPSSLPSPPKLSLSGNRQPDFYSSDPYLPEKELEEIKKALKLSLMEYQPTKKQSNGPEGIEKRERASPEPFNYELPWALQVYYRNLWRVRGDPRLLDRYGRPTM